jgi:hypothetical protein
MGGFLLPLCYHQILCQMKIGEILFKLNNNQSINQAIQMTLTKTLLQRNTFMCENSSLYEEFEDTKGATRMR